MPGFFEQLTESVENILAPIGPLVEAVAPILPLFIAPPPPRQPPPGPTLAPQPVFVSNPNPQFGPSTPQIITTPPVIGTNQPFFQPVSTFDPTGILQPGIPGGGVTRAAFGLPSISAIGPEAGNFFTPALTASGFRTESLVRVTDPQGNDRYWVGGQKLSARRIKSWILSSNRKRRCRKR